MRICKEDRLIMQARIGKAMGLSGVQSAILYSDLASEIRGAAPFAINEFLDLWRGEGAGDYYITLAAFLRQFRP